MNRPSMLTYAIGNPAMATVLAIGGCVAMYRSWVDDIGLGAGLVGALVLGSALNASARLRAYRDWKRAWDSMAGEVSRPPSAAIRRIKAALGLLIVGLVMLVLHEHRDDPKNLISLVGMVMVLAVAGIWMLVRFRRRLIQAKGKEPTDQVVSISVHEPLMDVPPLQVAYRQLPAHCLRALQPANNRTVDPIEERR